MTSRTKLQNMVRKSGMSQLEIAKKIGVDHTVLSLWVNGWKVPPKAKIAKLARVLKCTTDDLMEAA